MIIMAEVKFDKSKVNSNSIFIPKLAILWTWKRLVIYVKTSK